VVGVLSGREFRSHGLALFFQGQGQGRSLHDHVLVVGHQTSTSIIFYIQIPQCRSQINPNISIEKISLRASLGTLIFHRIFIFPREISSFSLEKMKIPWKISVPKLALSC
jgi:hypothetical protein